MADLYSEILSLFHCSIDFEARFDVILDSDLRGRDISEFFSHVLMLSGAFKITKHLSGELAGGVNAGALSATPKDSAVSS
jgi:hypothetical protein